jgi:hypothetical protein
VPVMASRTMSRDHHCADGIERACHGAQVGFEGKAGSCSRSSLLWASGEEVIYSPATRNAFWFLTSAAENPFESKYLTQREKFLRRTIWNWLLLRMEWTFRVSNLLLPPERKASQCTTQCPIALSTMRPCRRDLISKPCRAAATRERERPSRVC